MTSKRADDDHMVVYHGETMTVAEAYRRYKTSLASRRRPKPVVECPYCHAAGGVNVMGRWHFENCPKRNIGDA